MNSSKILEWLTKESDKKSEIYYGIDYFPFDKEYKIEDLIYELHNRKALSPEVRMGLSKFLNAESDYDEDEATDLLQHIFKNNVTFISLILNYLYPEKYIYYRVSKLELEIFLGFKFLSDIIEEFRFEFTYVGKKKDSLENYKVMNCALHEFAENIWGGFSYDPWSIQKKLHYFIYQGLGNLFLERNNYNRYWIMATNENYFDSLDNERETIWSARKEMKRNDLVFMYRQFPRKAITELYTVADDPYFDPYGAWDGFWINLRKLTPIEEIKMSEMKRDEVLSRWNFVKMQSQGTITDPVPHSIYNRLLYKLDDKIIKKYNLVPEQVIETGFSGQFSSEEEFEDKVIVPLLKRWGLKFNRQYSCDFVIGSQSHSCQLDFLVSDERGIITLIENKLKITHEKELLKATRQAKSYCLLTGINCFIVASPEAFWIYKLCKTQEYLLQKIEYDLLKEQEEHVRNLIIKLRTD